MARQRVISVEFPLNAIATKAKINQFNLHLIFEFIVIIRSITIKHLCTTANGSATGNKFIN